MRDVDRARFEAKFERTDGCWLWGRCVDRAGYGFFGLEGRTRRVHRVAYELYVGPIPDGLQLDHTCHDPEVCKLGNGCPHRRCVNPAHLRPVMKSVNVGRAWSPNADKTECPRGHSYTNPDVLYLNPRRRHRVCRVCQLAASRRYRDRRSAIRTT